jgi:hypothetical protein
MKEALDIINMAESVVDEVVNKLLQKLERKFLKRNITYCKNILRWSMYHYCNKTVIFDVYSFESNM